MSGRNEKTSQAGGVTVSARERARLAVVAANAYMTGVDDAIGGMRAVMLEAAKREAAAGQDVEQGVRDFLASFLALRRSLVESAPWRINDELAGRTPTAIRLQPLAPQPSWRDRLARTLGKAGTRP